MYLTLSDADLWRDEEDDVFRENKWMATMRRELSGNIRDLSIEEPELMLYEATEGDWPIECDQEVLMNAKKVGEGPKFYDAPCRNSDIKELLIAVHRKMVSSRPGRNDVSRSLASSLVSQASEHH